MFVKQRFIFQFYKGVVHVQKWIKQWNTCASQAWDSTCYSWNGFHFL